MRIYSAHDLIELFRARGFAAQARFGSAITFPRALNAGYRRLIEGTPPEILELYDVRLAGDRATLTFEVLNVRFVARAE